MRKSTAIENCKCHHPIRLYSPRLNRFRYVWNGENRMIRAVEAVVPTNRPATTISYAYDHQGRMSTKNIAGTNTVARSLLWDDYNIVRELDNGIATHNIWGLDLDGTLQGCGGVGGLLAVAKTNELHVAFYDANGNVSEYVSAPGAVSAHYEYSPFGEPLASQGESFSHQFSTKPYCRLTLTVEFQGRKYKFNFGRWFSRDSIETEVSYLFLSNNSVIFSDYLGFSKVPRNSNIWVSGIPKTVPAYKEALKRALAGGASQEHINTLRGGLKVLKRNVAQRGAISTELLGGLSAVGVGLSVGGAAVSIADFFGAWGDDIPDVVFHHSGEQTCDPPAELVATTIVVINIYADVHQRGLLWGLGGVADYQLWYENSATITWECRCNLSGTYEPSFERIDRNLDEIWLGGAIGSAYMWLKKDTLTLKLEESQ